MRGGGGGGQNGLPWYILLYNLLITFQYSDFFEKFELVFAVSALFPDQMLFFCMFGKMDISLTILVVFEYRTFRETFIDFSISAFTIEAGIMKLFHYV